MTCCKLHNLCIDKYVHVPRVHSSNFREGDIDDVILNNDATVDQVEEETAAARSRD